MSCRCNCGYTCGMKCDLDMMECIRQHFIRDCDHKWDGKHVEIENGVSSTCSKCGMTAIAHDMAVGP